MYFKFKDSEKKYKGSLSIVDSHTIKTIGLPRNLTGIGMFNDVTDKLMGNYFDYMYSYYDEDEVTFLYTNDNHKYVKPIIPIPIPIVPYVPTLEEIKRDKILKFSNICKSTIENGQDISLSNGVSDHFYYTQNDQMNIKNAFDIAYATKMAIPFYDGNNNCKIYSLQDIISIYISEQEYITYNLTLFHQLESMIKSLKTIKAVESVQFNMDSLTGVFLNTFNTMLSQAKLNVSKLLGK